MPDSEERRELYERPRLMTLAELAAICRVPLATAYAWRAKKLTPPGIRLGKHIRFESSAVERWLRERTEDR